MKSDGLPYLIPPDNPFQSDPDALDEIWAFGLRNPWRFSFDRSTGDLWIGDVGQGTWEEVDHQLSTSLGGENYGWDCREGAHTYSDTQPPGGNDDCPGKTFVEPVFEYAHTLGCSVTGGYVYRGAIPGLDGIYIFADYCSGRVWGLQQDEGTWVSQELTNGGFGLASFGEDETGELFVTRLDGTIFQLVSAAP
jgi:glucose/arabinose dehydrogenase